MSLLQERPHEVSSLHSVVEALQASGLVTHTLSEGDTKFMGVCRLSPYSTHRQGQRRDNLYKKMLESRARGLTRSRSPGLGRQNYFFHPGRDFVKALQTRVLYLNLGGKKPVPLPKLELFENLGRINI